MDDDLHHLEEDLRAITIDDDRPRYPPLRLDKMFNRATNWRPSSDSGSTSAPIRPPSPPRTYVPVLALPRPLKDGHEFSPLAGLFDYPELIPGILEPFERPEELAVLARVCKEFARIARKKLYNDIWVRSWEDAPKPKLIRLFETLQARPDLCKLVRKLDIRFFPLDMGSEKRYELEDAMQTALSTMENLERVVWTRDRSLSPSLVETLASLPHLRHLEISGHSYRYFDPLVLSRMPELEDLRIMMPDATFRDALRPLVAALAERPRGGLKGLGIMCRSSPLIDDKLIRDLAPNLCSLRRLQLIGCIRLTRAGVFDLLRETHELEELSIDALPHSDLDDLSSSPPLPNLHTLALTFTAPGKTVLSPSEIPRLPYFPSLRALDLTLSGTKRFLPTPCFFTLADQVDLGRLSRISMLNLVIGTEVLDHLLSLASDSPLTHSHTAPINDQTADTTINEDNWTPSSSTSPPTAPQPTLSELYISVNTKRVLLDSQALDHAHNLQVLHVNAPEPWGPRSDDLAEFAQRAKGLEQVGALNRVYEVHRRTVRVRVGQEGQEGKGKVGLEGMCTGEEGVVAGEVTEAIGSKGKAQEGEELIEEGKQEEVKFENVVELSRWSKTTIPNYFQIWRA